MIQYVPQDGFPRYVLYSMSPICLSKKSSLHSNTKVSSEYRKPYLRIPNADQDIFATEKSCSKETQLTSFKSATPKGIWPGNPVLMKEKKKDQLSKEVVFFRPCLGNAVLEAEGEGKAPWWGAWRIPGGKSDGKVREEGKRLSKFGIRSRWSVAGRDHGLCKGRSRQGRLITLCPGVLSRAKIQCVQLIEFTELGNWNSHSEGSE